MEKPFFVWDGAKSEANLRKHGVSFGEAAHVFADPLHQIVDDHGDHGEQRWHAIGQVCDCILLIVVHTRWEENDNGADVEIIRIISARRAERRERRLYER